jgi:site-specific DNA recombinase
MTTPAIVYAVSSKDEEVDDDCTGEQVSAIRAKIAAIGDRQVIGEPHVDRASGYRGSHGPALEAAIEVAVQHAPSELWVLKPDRLGRGTGRPNEVRAIGALLCELRGKGVTVRGVEEDDVLRNEMIWGMVSTMASQYSASLSADVSRGKRAAFEKGKWAGARYAPDGYTIGKQGGLVIDELRAPIVRRVAELFLSDGHSFNATARAVVAEGHRTQDGRPWRGSRVKEMLCHPVYAGYAVWHYREPDQEVRQGIHKAILDGDTWARLVVKLGLDPRTFRKLDGGGLRHRGSKGGRPSPTTILSGLATCARCGEPMWGRTSTYVRKDGTRQVAYTCASRKARTGTCDMPVIDATRIEGAIVEHLHDTFNDLEKWTAEQAAVNQRERVDLETQLTAARVDLEERERERDTARRRYIEKQSELREEVFECTRQQVTDSRERVRTLETKLATVPTEPSTDALLDAYSEFKRILTRDEHPPNERLKRLFAEFRLDVADDHFVVLPVLRADVIEARGGHRDTITVLERDLAIVKQHDANASDSRALLLVPSSSRR